MKNRIALACVLNCVLWSPVYGQENSVLQRSEEISPPEAWADQARRSGTVLDLSLDDSMRLALTNNLEIAIEEFNEDLNQERFVAARGFYDPILRFTIGVESSDIPSTSVLQAGSGVATFSSDRFTWNNALDQNVPGGGRLSLSLSNSRNATNSRFSTINPQFAAQFNVNFTQPLWRGFRRTQTERQLKLVNLDSEISDSQFRQKVSEIVEQVQNQYWELVFAIQDHETRRRSMELAQVQYQNNRQRVQLGVLAPIEVTSAQAEVSSRDQEMIQAEVQIVASQNSMKRLLAPDPRHGIWNITLIPTDSPTLQDVQISLQEAIDIGLARRPELEQITLRLDKAEVDRTYYAAEVKPSVNLRFDFGSTGRSGVVFGTVPVDLDGDLIPDTQVRVPDPDNPAFGNLIQSLDQVLGFNFNNWGIFADVEIPLFNRAREGELGQVRIEQARLMNEFKNQQQMIIVDVRNAVQSLAIQRKSLEVAGISRQLSEEQLDGETKRFEAGLSTNFEVLRFQRDLAQAQVQELRARVDYQKALTALRKAMYTIVDDNDILLARQKPADGGPSS